MSFLRLLCEHASIHASKIQYIDFFFFSSRRRHTRCSRDWSSDVCSSDLSLPVERPNELIFLENARYGPGQSFPNYKDLRDGNHTFAGLVGYRIAPMEMETEDRKSTRLNSSHGYISYAVFCLKYKK